MSSSQISLPEKAYFGGLQRTEIVEDVEAQYSIDEIAAYRPKSTWKLLRENAVGIAFWLLVVAFVLFVGLLGSGVILREDYMDCAFYRGEHCVPSRDHHQVIDDLFSAAGNVV
ncbi:hypothetical protein N7454_001266 [Penicillium verhagenii]|nr:hypothetical protein N7454_001266 [Penicillium verhagenii]